MSDVLCFHCGQPLPTTGVLTLQIGDVPRELCCTGCLTVAQLIVDSGCADFYLKRSVPSAKVDEASLLPAELALYDLPQALPATSADDKEDVSQQSELVFSVDGLRCSACVWLIETWLARQPGVSLAEMNVATGRLLVRRDPQRCAVSTILRGLRTLGYTAYPFDPIRQGEQARKASRRLFRQLFIAGMSMMQVMMYAIPVYMSPDGIEPDMMALMRWASLFLTIPAVCYSAMPFFTGALAGLRARAPGMDLPVAIGIGAAFIGSMVATFRGEGEIYFDSVSMFVFLLLASRYLETAARRKSASALERMQQASPASALWLANYPASREATLVPVAQLKAGDVILARPGDRVAADARLLDATAELDLSLLTGESKPQLLRAGADVPGGAVNISQPVLLQVARATRDSTLAALTRLAEQAGQGKPALAQWADKVASRFVVALLILAGLTFIAWQFVDPSQAWSAAIAVLVVSCPCALSLATPSALAAATDRLLTDGTLVVRGNVLETLEKADTILFDKTGTLTAGRPQLLHVALANCVDAGQALSIAAGMETGSLHPLATALVQAASERGSLPVEVDTFQSITGAGMQAQLGGRLHRIGSAAFVAELSGERMPDSLRGKATTGAGSVYLGDEHGWLARFDLADALRSDAVATVAQWRAAGKRTVLLSGDEASVCAEVGALVGIDEVVAGQSPQQKLAYVQKLQQGGAVVAIVGDGINDAAMLRAADVSFSMGGGAALAQVSADAVVLSDRLSSVAACRRMAVRTMRVVRQNLFWAATYNFLAIPAAAFGWLNPWMSAVGMSVSSLLVVCNALRLSRRESTRSSKATAQDVPAQPAVAGMAGGR